MGLLGDDALRRRRRLVESTTPTRAASVTPESSVVAVEGVVRVHEETLSPPLSDATVVEPPAGAPAEDEAADGDGGPTRLDELAAERGETRRGPPVLARYVRRPRESEEPGTATETRVEAVPFVVEDDSGRVLVDAREAASESVLLSPAVTERYLGDESGSRVARATGADDTRELARARTALGATPDWEHERATLRAGDQVYVLGGATGERGRIEPGGEGFVVSDLSRAALTEQLQRASEGLDRRFWLFAVVGAIAAVVLLITVAVLVDSFLL